jgi:hypothetical protein
VADGAPDVVIHVGNNLLMHWNRDSRQDVGSQHDLAGSWLMVNAIVAMRPLHMQPVSWAGHAPVRCHAPTAGRRCGCVSDCISENVAPQMVGVHPMDSSLEAL